MAAHLRDNVLHGSDHPDTHASANKWRHQESGSFHRHASPMPREANERSGSNDLAQFLNKSRVEGHESADEGTARSQPIMVPGNVNNGPASQTMGTQVSGGNAVQGSSHTGLEVKCGPLLNYRRMENETWFGSVLVVMKGGSGRADSPVVPELRLRIIGSTGNSSQEQVLGENGANATGPDGEPYGVVNGVNYTSSQGSEPATQSATNGSHDNNATASFNSSQESRVSGTKLYSDPQNTFWRFSLQIPMQQSQIQCEYTIPGLNFTQGRKTDKQNFFIPAISESCKILFHSCNGFSVGTDEDAWSGAALWNDVIRVHKKTPFHVM
jgi:hypothetical protein